MIHDNNGNPVSALNETVNPFYLFLSNDEIQRMPLPRAVKHGMKEALEWRDAWEYHATRETKGYCLFHPRLRNWVGGAENSLYEMRECNEYYGFPLVINDDYRQYPHRTGL